ncbi:putative monovalent cation/H+ antiporter subunit A [Myxococcus sp. RHSTA-1-4]|uniref:putative monovalent cation/H+ antiporter subunit A n=1 Tax=Myxococcus sp. RHSTA-1-4 TaxID=2874601 RepID=UPI001CBB1981|nr:putative monovalent cation/H+ antiporter subunit A [Myxococcus sp. RHSTA-1-4]MBZ4420007.1 putative monovalent cation/H+ antiporter subunit A [Myxococcus sp. RHSTA-1-4]
MSMLTALLVGFGAAAVAPALHRFAGRWTGALLTLVPAALFASFVIRVAPLVDGHVATERYAWAPRLMLHLSLRADGLALLMALLITGIGALVALYANRYLEGHPHLGRFYLFFFGFMSSMLGLVLSDNLLALFIFWELTSLTSYLLIGFDHTRDTSRAAALQGLLVTVGGGQALLVGVVMMGSAVGTLELSQLPGHALQTHPLYPWMLLLVLVGAFTKSAQFPFHFWLPGAMAAPTPVSAYLHSATMVKAGVFLLARLTPALGATPLWESAVTWVGGATMVVGAFLALGQRDLKLILAHATVCVLGTLTFLIGLGTALALHAMVVFLLAHALYKGALFLAAGAIDHATGTRDLVLLGGLRRAMPLTTAAVLLAAASMAGLVPALGFIGKELVYEGALAAPRAPGLATGATLLAFIPLVAVAAMLAVRPFFGATRELPHAPHEGPPGMWLGPLVLSVLGLVLGLFPSAVDGLLARASAVMAPAAPPPPPLKPWHGLNAALGLSVASLAGGAAVYFARDGLRGRISRLRLERWGPGRGYELALAGMLRFARFQTRLLQSGYLRRYLRMSVVAVGGLTAYALLTRARVWPELRGGDLEPYEAAVGVLMVLAAVTAARTRSRLASVSAMGVVGFGVALVFLFFGAPDLALTQSIVEALTVVVFLLALFHLPAYEELSSRPARLRDVGVSLAFGAVMATLLLVTVQNPEFPPISGYFLQNSVPGGHGRNVVNVILVDFRALDTLGEITVLAIAALGVSALLKAGRQKGTAR